MSDGRVVIDSIFDGKPAEKGLEEMKKNMDKASDKAKEVGTSMTTYLTLPLMAMGGAAILAASDFSGAQRTMQNGLGITRVEAEKLTAIANNIYKKGFGESLDATSKALVAVKQNFKDLITEAELKQVTTDAIVLAEVLGEDVSWVTRAGATLMKEFGVTSSNAFDLIAWGSQNGLNFSQELLDNIAEYGPLFSNMGYSAEEYFNLLKKGAEEGSYNLDYINDVMKEFQIRVKDGSKATSEAMGLLSSSTNKVWEDFKNGKATVKDVNNAVLAELSTMDNKVLANQIGVGLYGTKFEDLEADAVLALGNVSTEIENLDGTMKSITESQEQSFGQRFQSRLRETKDALVPVGNVLMDLADRYLPPIVSFIQKLSQWFSNLSPAGQTVTIVLGMLVAMLGPLTMFVGMLIGLFANLTVVAGAFGIGVLPLVGIIAGVIAAIVALVAIGVLLWNNWDTIKAKAIEIWEGIKNWFSQFWTSTKELFKSAVESIKEFISNAWESIKTAAITLWGIIVSTVMAIIRPFINGITNIFNGMKGGLSTIMKGLSQYFSGVWQVIKNIFLGAVLLILDLVTGDFEGLKSHAIQIFNNIKTGLSNIWEGIKTVFSGALQAIGGAVKAAWDNLKNNTKAVFEWIKTTISSIWSSIKSFFSSTVNNIWNTVTTKFQNMVSSVRDKMGSVKSTIQNLWNQAKSFLSNINLFSIGKNIIQGLLRGISNMANAVKNKAKEIANSVTNTIKSALNIHSPSRVMRDEIGEMIPAGVAVGMDNGEDDLIKKANQMAMSAVPDVPSISSMGSAVPNGAFGKLEDLLKLAIGSSAENSQSLNITIPLVINGKEFARATGRDILEFLDNEALRRGVTPVFGGAK